MGRDEPGPEGRPIELDMGRRAPGGGGIGRPVELRGRPGGGGIGRPVELSGGRVDGVTPSAPASGDVDRWVGRIVVGPFGEAVRTGAGFATTARLRTPLVVEPSSAVFLVRGAGSTGAAALAPTGGSTTTVVLTVGATCAGAVTVTATVAATSTGVGGSISPARWGAVVAAAVCADFDSLAALVDFVTSSDCTGRRSPSASARRRMRSAWASSIDAEGLDAPIPSFWASASNSLLDRPSSLESSCTRIFFSAKTFP